jgi:hypothetical protein
MRIPIHRWREFLGWTADQARLLFEILRITRSQVFVALLAFVAFAFPPQIHELYRVFAEGGLERSVPTAIAVVLSILLSFSLWNNCQWLVWAAPQTRIRYLLGTRRLLDFM